MDLIEKVGKTIKILDENYDVDDMGLRYQYYVETVCEFDGNKEELLEIIKLYGKDIKEYILSKPEIIDVIMQEERIHRHDLDINAEVDLDYVLQSIFSNQELTGFSERAKHVILLEAMNMHNVYGMDMLRTAKERVKKEIDYGVYGMKTDPDRVFTDTRKERVATTAHARRDYEEIMRLGDKYGKDALPYIENLELLHQRAESLIDIVEPSLQGDLIKLTTTLATIISAKDTPDSTLKIDAEMLESIFSTYEKINHLTLKHLMGKKTPSVIDKPTGELLMLHFIQDENETTFDIEMNKFLAEEVMLTAKKMISEAKGRPYDETLDQADLQAILDQYQESRENPVNLASRIPLRCKYTGKSGGVGFAQVLTKPTTLLSVSIATPEDLNIHLNRRIAIGFLPDDIPIDAIAATSKKFNSEKDRVEFTRGKHSIADIMRYNKENNNTNETLVDWTKVKPGYILVVKDKQLLEPEILERAQQLGEKNNLPIVIYDAYAIKRNGITHDNSQKTDSSTSTKQ